MEYTFNMNMQLLEDCLETIETVYEELDHDVDHTILISDNEDVNDDAEESTEQEMSNDAEDGGNDVEHEVAVAIESSQQNEENAESDDENQNVDRFEREMANLETNPNGVHEVRATEVFPTDSVIVAIPEIMEFMQDIAGNEEIAIRYLTEKCIFYGAGELFYPGGSALRWRSNGNRGYAWRCNGVITNYESGERYCSGTTRSSKFASFFYKKKIPCAQVLLILYFWLHHSRRMDIANMVKIHPSTVARCSIHATIQCLNIISRVEPNVTIRSVTP